MDSRKFELQKREILSERFPYKILEKSDIVSKGNNVIDLAGLEIEVEDNIQNEIDRFIGVSQQQIKAIETTFGNTTTRDMRNCFALANEGDRKSRLAVFADPKTHKITSTKQINGEPISMEAFFDFLEMFMNDNSYYPESIRMGSNGALGLNVTLKPHHEQFGGIGGEDEFLTNALYFKWDLGEIEGGNYIERLVCTNGQTQTIPHREATINDLQPDSIKRLLRLPENKRAMNHNIERLYENAAIAQHSVASLAEVKYANKMLTKAGVNNPTAENIAPITQLEEMYDTSGLIINPHRRNRYKSDINFWDLYNKLTYFASHNELWGENDIRRDALMHQSLDFLFKPRDIKEYISIFD